MLSRVAIGSCLLSFGVKWLQVRAAEPRRLGSLPELLTTTARAQNSLLDMVAVLESCRQGGQCGHETRHSGPKRIWAQVFRAWLGDPQGPGETLLGLSSPVSWAGVPHTRPHRGWLEWSLRCLSHQRALSRQLVFFIIRTGMSGGGQSAWVEPLVNVCGGRLGERKPRSSRARRARGKPSTGRAAEGGRGRGGPMLASQPLVLQAGPWAGGGAASSFPTRRVKQAARLHGRLHFPKGPERAVCVPVCLHVSLALALGPL